MTVQKTNPTIAFDTWSLGPYARNHGVYVYAQKLLGYFREMASQYSVEIAPWVSPVAGNGASMFAPMSGFHPIPARLLAHSRSWRWGGASLMAALGDADLVFSPAGTTLYFNTFINSVVTIHDLIPLIVPLESRRISRTLKFFYRRAAQSSHTVITDSNHSKSDLVNLFQLPESKVSVVYLGCDKENFNALPNDPELHRALVARLGIAKPYIVHHGVIKSYKNLKRLIQAYRAALVRNRNLDLELVLAGPLGWDYDEILAEANKGAGRRGKVIFTQSLSDPDLAMLVKGASLAVIPSLYEGFCLPLVESMACGVPTIAADRSCLPEVSGGVLRYFNPESVEEMSASMEDALENEGLRRELAHKGCAQAERFDWLRCAEETLAILARVAHEKTGKG